jgi:hypothetical protein
VEASVRNVLMFWRGELKSLGLTRRATGGILIFDVMDLVSTCPHLAKITFVQLMKLIS